MKHNINIIYTLSLFAIALSWVPIEGKMILQNVLYFTTIIGLAATSLIWLIVNKEFTIIHLVWLQMDLGIFFLGLCHQLFQGKHSTITVVLLCCIGAFGILMLISASRLNKIAKNHIVEAKEHSYENQIEEINNYKPNLIRWIAIWLYFLICCLESLPAVRRYGFKRFLSGNGPSIKNDR